MDLPVDYTMCCQTVTVYRKTPRGILRTELPGCHLQWEERVTLQTTGWGQERRFLLIQPGQSQQVFAGDRIFDGIGPEISQADWQRFVPVLVEGLGEVTYAIPYQWQGQFCHTEAGRK